VHLHESGLRTNLQVDIELIAPGSQARADFEADFKTQMATNIGGVPAEKIFVDGIAGGGRRLLWGRRALQSTSVTVDFHIVAPASVQTEAAALLGAVGAAAVVITVGGVAAAASSISAPATTAVPDTACVGTWADCAADCADATYSHSVVQSGQGAACPTAHGELLRSCAAPPVLTHTMPRSAD
jgi:hypothetical protein